MDSEIEPWDKRYELSKEARANLQYNPPFQAVHHHMIPCQSTQSLASLIKSACSSNVMIFHLSHHCLHLQVGP